MADDHQQRPDRGRVDAPPTTRTFYNVTLKNFVAPWTNRDGDVFVPLNDYTATVIGMVRDDADFRNILFGDVLYVGSRRRASGLLDLQQRALRSARGASGVDLSRPSYSRHAKQPDGRAGRRQPQACITSRAASQGILHRSAPTARCSASR